MTFSVYNEATIRELSVKPLVNPVAFDPLGTPTIGGLYDPALGPVDNNENCSTCGLLGVHCPGHLGHIELPLYVYHPIFFQQMFQLLRSKCRSCHYLKQSPLELKLLEGQLRLLKARKLIAATSLIDSLDAPMVGEGDVPDDDVFGRIDEAVAAGLEEEDVGSSIHIEKLQQELVTAFFKSCLGTKNCPVGW